MAGRFSVETVFRAVDKMSAPVSRMERRVKKFSRSLERGMFKASRALDGTTAKMKSMGATAAATGALVGFGLTDIIRTGAEFDQTITNAAAKFGIFDRESDAFIAVKNKALELGESTEFMASQAAGALDFFAKAGFTAAEAIETSTSAVDFATVAQMDLAEAADIATDAVGALGLATDGTASKGENFARVSDLMAKTSISANTSVVDMFEAIKDGGPSARLAGASIEEIAVIVAAFAQNGIKATRGGTALKRTMLAIAAPTSGGAKALRSLGVATTEVVDGVKEVRNVLDVFGDINSAIEKLDPAERAPFVDAIFGKIGAAAAIGLMKQSGDQLDTLKREIFDYRGTAGKLAAFQRDTLKGSFLALGSAIESVKISVTDMEGGPLKNLVDRMTDWVRANKNLIATRLAGFLSTLIENFGLIVKTIVGSAGLIVGMTTLNNLIGIATGAITLFNAVLFANPAVQVAAGVAVLIAAVAAAITWFGKWDEVIKFVTDTATAAFAFLKAELEIFALAGKIIMAEWEPLVEFFTSLWGQLVDVFKSGADKLMEFLGPVVGAVTAFTEGAASIASSVGAGASDLFGGVTNALGITREVGADEAERLANPNVSGPQERFTKQLIESKSVNQSEVTIKPTDGAEAELTGGKLGSGVKLAPSGAF